MKTLNSINIRGPVERIFDLACEVENWPKLLPHYRHVSVISDDGVSRIVEMNCVRDFGPIRWHCQWVARQQVILEDKRIIFVHLAGPARGMAVEWRLEPESDGVHTSISHELRHRLGPIYSDHVLGPLFVSPIASKTLGTIKALVEAEVAK